MGKLMEGRAHHQIFGGWWTCFLSHLSTAASLDFETRRGVPVSGFIVGVEMVVCFSCQNGKRYVSDRSG